MEKKKGQHIICRNDFGIIGLRIWGLEVHFDLHLPWSKNPRGKTKTYYCPKMKLAALFHFSENFKTWHAILMIKTVVLVVF